MHYCFSDLSEFGGCNPARLWSSQGLQTLITSLGQKIVFLHKAVHLIWCFLSAFQQAGLQRKLIFLCSSCWRQHFLELLNTWASCQIAIRPSCSSFMGLISESQETAAWFSCLCPHTISAVSHSGMRGSRIVSSSHMNCQGSVFYSTPLLTLVSN